MIIIIFKINNKSKYLCPFLNLNFKCKARIANIRIKVYIAGYILKAPIKSPCIISPTERCMPQPKHSIPNSFLFKQGSMKSSIEDIKNDIIVLQMYKKANY